MTILLTGGSGLLGKSLLECIDDIPVVPPTHKSFDIVTIGEKIKDRQYRDSMKNLFDLIVHCAAYTDLASAELNKEECYKTNVLGTRNLARLGIPMLYISTEYVFDGEKGNYCEEDYPNPKNFYGLTKLMGEYQSRRTRSVVVRCLFKPRPFKHAFGCIDQFTTGDYVNIIAPEIALAIKKFNHLPPTVHIGTGKKSTYELARETREVGQISINDVRGVSLPRDTSLDCSKWNKLKERFRED